MYDIQEVKIDVAGLGTASLYAEPVKYDWNEHLGWCEIVLPPYKDEDDHIIFEISPNYYYPLVEPLGRDINELATLLDECNVPLVPVYFWENNKYGLALTGGGMNMSWEICYAYMLAGHLPPLSVCSHLPKLAIEFTGWQRQVLEACMRSAKEAKCNWLFGWLSDLSFRKREERNKA